MSEATKTTTPDSKRGFSRKIGSWFCPPEDSGTSENEEALLEPLLPFADQKTYQRYAGAFRTIIEKDVTCVAVTGPYGAGKTSLINAFYDENALDYDFIRISLATFEGDAKENITSDMVEKSILQQLIYSVGAKKLEYSRFKKIRKPTWLRVKAVFLGVFAIWTGLTVKYWEKIETFFAAADNWKEYLALGFFGTLWFALLIVIVHGVLKAFAGLSIKKFSLKNAEIETEDKSKESVFNKHLDEIVYFFQETPCDIVIIEDLDRFGKTGTFTKIREINQLVNENETIKERRKKKKQTKPIVFLFAIRDDLFKGKDRTKFFDLLIPVIPFVSAGNSYDVLSRKLSEAGLRDGLQKKFLRQISIYISDNRHLVNIVNEYAIYRKNLNEARLDPNKLFSIILYKVFYPSDFGKLHMNEGVLSEIVNGLQHKRRERHAELSNELKQIKDAEVQVREGESPLREALANAYVGAFQRKFRQPMRAFRPANSHGEVSLSEDVGPILTGLQKDETFYVITVQGRAMGPASLAEFEEVVHPGLKIKERLQEIDRITRLQESGIAVNKVEVLKKIRDSRYFPMSQAFSTEEITEKVSKLENIDLFVYLIKEGYLGEDFDDYTSYFHKGAITRSDRDFVMRFNRDDEIDFAERVDTPAEILLVLDDGLFGKPQGFNVTIVDYILGSAGLSHRVRLVEGFRAFPDEGFSFLETYYADGKQVDKLLRILVRTWDDFIEASAKCEAPLSHVQQILKSALDKTIAALRQPSSITQFIERNAPEIFVSSELVNRIPLLAKSGIRIVDCGFSDLESADRSTAISHVVDHALWKITPENVSTLLEWQGIEEKVAKSEMFLSLESSPSELFDYVQTHINNFVESCFLEVDSTTEELQEGVEHLLCVEGLDEELGNRIIARQEAKVRFLNIPSVYWTTAITEQKYVIGWENIDELLVETEDFKPLEPIFQSEATISTLAAQPQEISKELFDFLVDFDGMSLEGYKQLISPELGSIEVLPGAIGVGKKLHLVRCGMVSLNTVSYAWCGDDDLLRVALIEENLETYKEEVESWELNNSELACVLNLDISAATKRKALLAFGGESWDEDPDYLNEIVGILADDNFDIVDFDEDFVERVLRAALSSQAVAILTRMIPVWDEERVMENLKEIGEPFDVIAEYGRKPFIPGSSQNQRLLEQLHDNDYIMSFKPYKAGFRVQNKKPDL